MPTSHKPRISGSAGRTGRMPERGHGLLGLHRARLAPPMETAARTSVAWSGLVAAAIISALFMVLVVSNTGDVRISFAGMSGTLPLALALLAALGVGIVVTLILGTARLTQLRPLARKRIR